MSAVCHSPSRTSKTKNQVSRTLTFDGQAVTKFEELTGSSAACDVRNIVRVRQIIRVSVLAVSAFLVFPLRTQDRIILVFLFLFIIILLLVLLLFFLAIAPELLYASVRGTDRLRGRGVVSVRGQKAVRRRLEGGVGPYARVLKPVNPVSTASWGARCPLCAIQEAAYNISSSSSMAVRFRPQTVQLQECFCCSFIFCKT